MDEPIDFALLDRFLVGESTAAEADAVEARARQDRAFAALLAELRRGTADVGEWDVDAGWSQLRRGVRSRRRLWKWAPVAAAASLIAALGIGVFMRYEAGDSASAVAVREHSTAAGERRVVTLPDGSTVTLAPRSNLIVPVEFAAGERRVTLRGEAFFDVQSDSLRPFVVAAAGTLTRVLGTSFNVSAYSEQAEVVVVVATGRVLVKPNGAVEGRTLEPGQMARTDSTRIIAVESAVDVNAHTAWRDGRLIFRDVTFADAVPRLERWYGIDLRVADPTLGETRFTAFLDKQQLEDVLAVLAATLNARYERLDSIVTFHPRQ